MKFTGLFAAAVSGSFGGLTGSHNKGGMYIRARSVPTDPNTSFQQAARDNLRVAVDQWTNVLTASDRDDWADYAANTPVIDRLGIARTLSGQQMFIRGLTSQLLCAPSIGLVLPPPTVFDLGSFTPPTFAPDDSAQNTAVSFNNGDDWASNDDGWMGVFQSRPQNPSVNYFKGPYRFIGAILGVTLIPPASPSSFASPFTLTTGQRVFYQVRTMTPTSRLSNTARYFDTVVA